MRESLGVSSALEMLSLMVFVRFLALAAGIFQRKLLEFEIRHTIFSIEVDISN